MKKAATCPNCTSPVNSHPENGCVLAALMQAVRDRGEKSEAEVFALHATADVDALWELIGPIIDKLESGELSDADEALIRKAESDSFYVATWNELNSLMTEKMVALVAAIKCGDPDIEISDIVKSGPEENMSSSDGKVSFDICLSDENIVILSVDFKLIDGNDNGDGDGVAISCVLDGYGGLVMGGYTPNNYSDSLYVTDVDEIRSRIESLDVDEMATYILNEVLTDESLLNAIDNRRCKCYPSPI